MSENELLNKSCPNPTCEFDKHHPKANFCILCGTLLFRRCESCLDVNPRYAKFCQHCGANLDELREATPGAPPRTENPHLAEEVKPAVQEEKKEES